MTSLVEFEAIAAHPLRLERILSKVFTYTTRTTAQLDRALEWRPIVRALAADAGIASAQHRQRRR